MSEVKVPANIRVMLAIVASPTIAIMVFQVFALMEGDWRSLLDVFNVFIVFGLMAYYIVFTSRLPFRKRKQAVE